MSDSPSTTSWVTVAEAAEKAQVDTGTIRQWYRSGRLPTRRAEGERGAFLVPLDLVLGLTQPGDPAPVRSIEAVQEGVTADDHPAALTSLQRELEESREQLGFLRSQLAEVSEENRSLRQQLEQADDQRADLRRQLADAVDDRKGVEARLATVEAELTQLRRAAARSSITDPSWLDQQTPAYESPVRRQAMAPGPAAPTPAGGPTAPFEAPASDLSGLLAATRPDGSEPEPETDADTGDAGGPDGASSPSYEDDDRWGDRDEVAASRAIWTDEAPHPPLGEAPDDLLPEHEKKGRFGKR